jgi:hypothetical protein
MAVDAAQNAAQVAAQVAAQIAAQNAAQTGYYGMVCRLWKRFFTISRRRSYH